MKQKVYLAGGFYGDWHEKVKQLDGFIFLDPKDKETPIGVSTEKKPSVNEYGVWDLHYVKQSDIIFAYVERSNPACIGLAVEAGYAKGLGKTVILILEPNHETIKDRYLQFIGQVSDITFDNLEDGLNYLKTFKISA